MGPSKKLAIKKKRRKALENFWRAAPDVLGEFVFWGIPLILGGIPLCGEDLALKLFFEALYTIWHA